jgi:hypothetical protein
MPKVVIDICSGTFPGGSGMVEKTPVKELKEI